jgi:G-rich domain on putative tyrosine kinase/Chain length determinant protein
MSEAEPGNYREAVKGPPSGYFIVVPEPGSAADDLASFGGELLTAWRILAATMMAGALLALVIALLLPPKYRAKALVAPVTQNEGGGAGGTLRQLSGLAALANIDIGAGGGRKEQSLATLNSMGFAREFIETHHLLPILFADRWDAQAGRWKSGARVPTLGDAAKYFTDDVVAIDDDKKTSFVTVTVDWYVPELAAQWANGMIELVNDKLRAEAISHTSHSLEYLNGELAKTNVVELRQAIYRLVEEQENNAMLANVQHDYAYHFIDPAAIPERKYSPKRALMTAVGAAVGLFVGTLLVYLRRAHGRRAAAAPART